MRDDDTIQSHARREFIKKIAAIAGSAGLNVTAPIATASKLGSSPLNTVDVITNFIQMGEKFRLNSWHSEFGLYPSNPDADGLERADKWRKEAHAYLTHSRSSEAIQMIEKLKLAYVKTIRDFKQLNLSEEAIIECFKRADFVAKNSTIEYLLGDGGWPLFSIGKVNSEGIELAEHLAGISEISEERMLAMAEQKIADLKESLAHSVEAAERNYESVVSHDAHMKRRKFPIFGSMAAAKKMGGYPVPESYWDDWMRGDFLGKKWITEISAHKHSDETHPLQKPASPEPRVVCGVGMSVIDGVVVNQSGFPLPRK